MYRSFLKRLFDIILSLLGLVIFSPLLLILAVIVRVNLGSPVIFSQRRPGKSGRIFKLYKFRSMTSKKDESGELLPDSERLTRFGRLLRASSMDELPEFWNILKGDMSVVGPRPLLTQYLPLYSDEQARRHNVRPGLTGLAQVNGRNALSWPERFALDCLYVDNVSFWLDFKILLTTAERVFQRSGISSGTCETMEPFTGNAEE